MPQDIFDLVRAQLAAVIPSIAEDAMGVLSLILTEESPAPVVEVMDDGLRVKLIVGDVTLMVDGSGSVARPDEAPFLIGPPDLIEPVIDEIAA